MKWEGSNVLDCVSWSGVQSWQKILRFLCKLMFHSEKQKALECFLERDAEIHKTFGKVLSRAYCKAVH